MEVLNKSTRLRTCKGPAVRFTYGEAAPERGKDLSKVTESAHGRVRPTWELAVFRAPCAHLSLNDNHKTLPSTWATLLGLEGLWGGGRLKLPSPVFPAGSNSGVCQRAGRGTRLLGPAHRPLYSGAGC